VTVAAPTDHEHVHSADRHQTVDAPFATALLELAARREDLVVLAADLAHYTDVQPFADVYPDRFFQVGMAEQNLMGVAAGLAKSGFVPIITTYCVFASRRAYEQVALALRTGSRPAVITAFLPGITTPFRATHQGTDDLSLMRNIPGISVVDPADATELAAALPAAVDHGSTVYLRGLRGQVRRVFDPVHHDFSIGPAFELRAGTAVGVVATGLATTCALDALDDMATAGIDAGLLHVPTIKPVDTDGIAAFVARFPTVVTVENHARVGGLGTVVAEVIAEHGTVTRLHRLGVPDQWPPAGSVEHIRAALALDTRGIVEGVIRALGSGGRTVVDRRHP